jgi:predicted RNA binding protein YcfA (HicA-like mRNA interferase family)
LSLPVVGWKQVLKALRKKGFYPTGQSGSHIMIENGKGLRGSIQRRD